VDLGVGETTVLQGEYVTDPDAFNEAKAIGWRVSYKRADTLAHEDLVTAIRQD
jgi:hypothetical protein